MFLSYVLWDNVTKIAEQPYPQTLSSSRTNVFHYFARDRMVILIPIKLSKRDDKFTQGSRPGYRVSPS